MLQAQGSQAFTAEKKPLVLVVDDDEALATALSIVLQSSGYETRVCNRATEAMEQLRAGALPDLILFDLMMPEMSGWQFRVEMRKNPLWASIPVIAMSADSSPQAAAIDADAYLKKPIDAAALVSAVTRLLEDAAQARAEAHTAELERLSSLGLIAAGIAHEINNPLAFALGNLQMARRQVRELQTEVTGVSRARLIALSRQLDNVETGAQRVADVVRSVGAFTRPDTTSVSGVDVLEVLDTSIQLVDHELRHVATMARTFGAVPEVMGNAARLGQVFVNLLTNAVHAVSDAAVPHPEIRVIVEPTPEGDALITIADNGPGMSPGHLARIFDPFFSTKPAGSGMGLGLAISHRIVTSMGGTLTAESELGKGSRFFVRLPALRKHTQVPEPVVPTRNSSVHARKPRVLVVDDEEMMCRMLESLLEDDYDIVTLTDARQALDELSKGATFDIILCDLMMPDLSGMDLYAQLARTRPDQAERMLFMTGGTFTERAQAFVQRLTTGYLAKPFAPHALSSLVNERLASLGLVGTDWRKTN